MFARILLSLPITIVLLSLLDPEVHILGVGASLALFFELLFTHLLSQIIVKLLMPESILILPVDVLQVRLLILLNALLDVESLLLTHSLFFIVANDVSHAIHHGLDALAPLSHFIFTSLLFFQGQAHIQLNLLLVSPLDRLSLIHALLLLVEVLLNDFHCGLSILYFLLSFVVFLLHNLSGKPVDLLPLLIPMPLRIFNLLLL